MTVQKLTYPAKENAVQEKVNEIIDNLGGGGGSVDIDNLSITENASNQLQTVGVIDQNNTSTAIKTWTGTKAQYDAITTKDSNTLYNITDDTDVSLTILEALYPVGSVYLTYNSGCPLQTLGVGTWILESTGIVTSVDTDVPVKGNGMALGFDTGITSPAGYEHMGLRIGDGYQSTVLVATTGNYGATVGSATTGSGTANGRVGGVTTDSTKSGIVGTVTRSVSTINIFRRTV